MHRWKARSGAAMREVRPGRNRLECSGTRRQRRAGRGFVRKLHFPLERTRPAWQNRRAMSDDPSTKVFVPDPVNEATREFAPADPNGATLSSGGRGRPPTDLPSLAAPPPDGVPGYTLIRELGRGGMGVVYLARQVGL